MPLLGSNSKVQLHNYLITEILEHELCITYNQFQPPTQDHVCTCVMAGQGLCENCAH